MDDNALFTFFWNRTCMIFFSVRAGHKQLKLENDLVPALTDSAELVYDPVGPHPNSKMMLQIFAVAGVTGS